MIQCEGQSNTGKCVAIAKGVGDVLDSSLLLLSTSEIRHTKKVRIE